MFSFFFYCLNFFSNLFVRSTSFSCCSLLLRQGYMQPVPIPNRNHLQVMVVGRPILPWVLAARVGSLLTSRSGRCRVRSLRYSSCFFLFSLFFLYFFFICILWFFFFLHFTFGFFVLSLVFLVFLSVFSVFLSFCAILWFYLFPFSFSLLHVLNTFLITW